MRYLFLIYSNEAEEAARSPEQNAAVLQEWFAYDAGLRQQTAVHAGNALMPTSTATTVRRGGASPMVSDGPFAETKEQLGGFYMVEAKDIDEAIKLAAGMPHLKQGGSVELRPIMEFDS